MHSARPVRYLPRNPPIFSASLRTPATAPPMSTCFRYCSIAFRSAVRGSELRVAETCVVDRAASCIQVGASRSYPTPSTNRNDFPLRNCARLTSLPVSGPMDEAQRFARTIFWPVFEHYGKRSRPLHPQTNRWVQQLHRAAGRGHGVSFARSPMKSMKTLPNAEWISCPLRVNGIEFGGLIGGPWAIQKSSKLSLPNRFSAASAFMRVSFLKSTNSAPSREVVRLSSSVAASVWDLVRIGNLHLGR